MVSFLNPSCIEPQSQQTGAISETPSTCVTVWVSPETLPQQTYGPTQAAFPNECWSWLMLHNFLNPLKQATTVPVSPRPSTSSSQPRFTPWLHLGISKPSTSSSHLRLIYSSGRVALGEAQMGDELVLHHTGNPRAYAPRGQHVRVPPSCPPPPSHIPPL